MLAGGAKLPEVAGRLGISSSETLRRWVRQAEVDRGLAAGPTTEEQAEAKRLGKELAHQQRAHEILEAVRLLQTAGAGPATIALIDLSRSRWPVAAICRAVGLSERTYYAAKARSASARRVADEAVKAEVSRIWEASGRTYGSRRVWLALRQAGLPSARCQVERLMADMGIRGIQGRS